MWTLGYRDSSSLWWQSSEITACGKCRQSFQRFQKAFTENKSQSIDFEITDARGLHDLIDKARADRAPPLRGVLESYCPTNHFPLDTVDVLCSQPATSDLLEKESTVTAYRYKFTYQDYLVTLCLFWITCSLFTWAGGAF